jgi:hypothetical protein
MSIGLGMLVAQTQYIILLKKYLYQVYKRLYSLDYLIYVLLFFVEYLLFFKYIEPSLSGTTSISWPFVLVYLLISIKI